MNSAEQKAAAKRFVDRWQNRGDEKQDTHNFWYELLQEVYGVEKPSYIFDQEKRVSFNGSTKFIDGYIKSTKVLIEQKGEKIDITKAEKQSDGSVLTPYEQGKRYADNLNNADRPRWIVVCNFQKFEVHDLENLDVEPIVIELKDLPKAFNSLSFLINLNDHARHAEMDISVKAATLIGKLYDALLKQYGEDRAKDDDVLKSLNKLCVRIVFCLYAEDSGVFPIKDQFGNFLREFKPDNIGDALEKLFRVLNTKTEKRSPSLAEKYKAFPYVNGGLFADDDAEIPPFNDEVLNILLHECSEDFDWSQISPTIFGAMFESTLNPETRRAGGMHYTSIENIHKVIDPLFLDDLKEELKQITNDEETKYNKKGREKLREFQKKLASLKFLDPACGSGNFLTETYISLRQLENEVLRHLNSGMVDLFIGQEDASQIQVQLNQFYGIEINDFAVTVAKTALWIAESQLIQETEKIINKPIDFLPLKTYTNIVEGNALRLNWEEVVPANELNYIMGNPPFLGARVMSKEQKNDLLEVSHNQKGVGDLDFVCGWYYKAADYLDLNPNVEVAFVSTNSISQGQQPALLWKNILPKGIKINFAYRTFIWNNEASDIAHVHCVIIGFSKKNKDCKIYENTKVIIAEKINPYLIDAPILLLDKRNTPLSDVPICGIGNKPIDGGFYLFKEEEKDLFIQQEPNSKKFFKKWFGAEELIKGKSRYCLWLGDASPSEIKSMPKCFERVLEVKNFRLNSSSAGTRKIAEKPTRFHVENFPSSDYLALPRVSSERRYYLPLGYLSKDDISSDAVIIIPSSSLYCFGTIISSVHMAWLRTVCGRLKSDYRYSVGVVYNNFIWPNLGSDQKAKIEKTAQVILDVRSKYPDSSLADLYDPDLMPYDLLKAHQANDKAVMEAYGFKQDMTEPEIVAELMKLYQKAVESEKK